MIDILVTLATKKLELLIFLSMLLLSFLYGIYNYRTLSKEYRYLLQLLLVTFSIEFLAFIFTNNERLINIGMCPFKTNYPFYHALNLMRLFYNGIIYYYLFISIRIKTKIILHLTYILCGLVVINSLFIQPICEFPSYNSILVSLFIITNALIIYNRMIQSPINIPILKQSIFWFNSGSLFFNATTFLIYGYFQSYKALVPDWAYILIKVASFLLLIGYGLSIYMNVNRTKYGAIK